MKYFFAALLLIMLVAWLAGCADPNARERAALRHQYFVECMKLAPPVRGSISDCDVAAGYQANATYP